MSMCDHMRKIFSHFILWCNCNGNRKAQPAIQLFSQIQHGQNNKITWVGLIFHALIVSAKS